MPSEVRIDPIAHACTLSSLKYYFVCNCSKTHLNPPKMRNCWLVKPSKFGTVPTPLSTQTFYAFHWYSWVQEVGGGGGGGKGGTGGTKKWYQLLHESRNSHQLLHITLTIPELRLPLQNEHFLPCEKFTMTQSFFYFNDAMLLYIQTYTLYLMNYKCK